jgi:molybdopterin synthase sulfur carrier subunit
MKVNVLAFGIARDIMGGSMVGVEVPNACSIGVLKELLTNSYPALTRLSSFAIAVNGEYAMPDRAIKSGDEVAIIPPVSGG